jgi:hypothetical protein
MTITERLKDMLTNDTPARPSARAAAAHVSTINLDHSFATRAVQLSTARKSADKRLAAQRAASEQALRNAERAHADEDHALKDAEQETRAMLRAALVRAAHETFESPVAAWLHEPSRAVALTIVEALVGLARRELTELGPSAARPHVLLALSHVLIDGVAKGSPAVLVTLSSDSGWTSRMVGALASIMSRAVLPASEGRIVSGAVAEALIVELEASVEAVAVANQDRPPEARAWARWQLVKAQDDAALAAFDDELVREQAAVTEASCTAWGSAILRAQSASAERATHDLGGDAGSAVGFE